MEHGPITWRDAWEAAGWSVNPEPPPMRPDTGPMITGTPPARGPGGPTTSPRSSNGRNKTFFYFSDDNDLRPVQPTSVGGTPCRPRFEHVQKATSVRFRSRSSTRLRRSGSCSTATRSGSVPLAISSPAQPFPARFRPISFPGYSRPEWVSPCPINHAFVNTSQVTDHVWAFKINREFCQREESPLVFPNRLDSQVSHAVGDYPGPLGILALGDTYSEAPDFPASITITLSRPPYCCNSTYRYSRYGAAVVRARIRAGLFQSGFPRPHWGFQTVIGRHRFAAADFPIGGETSGSPTGGMYSGMNQGKVAY